MHDSGRGGVPLDTVFRVLSHPTRRRILTSLSEHQLEPTNPVTVDELTPAEYADGQFHIKLYHTHLPHLDTAGFINWNPTTDTITPGPHYDTIHSVVTLLKTNDDRLSTGWP